MFMSRGDGKGLVPLPKAAVIWNCGLLETERQADTELREAPQPGTHFWRVALTKTRTMFRDSVSEIVF